MKSDGTRDHMVLHQQIFRQATDDYVKLQHPKQRKKKYLKEAWWSAVDLFFDPDYRFQHLGNEDGDPMSLHDLLMVAADRQNLVVLKLHEYLVRESIRYWNKKPVKTVEIPSDVIIEGHVYAVKYKNCDEYTVTYSTKTIWLDPSGSDSTKQEAFVTAVTETIAYHTEAKMSKKARQTLAKGWFRALRINSCFTGDS